jgi:hypothetical protein|nr:MAG TPA: hypothetical protein [Caudoviricetes sp.]
MADTPEEDVSRETEPDEAPAPEEMDESDVVEAESDAIDADLTEMISEVRQIAEEALAQCTELRAIIEHSVIDEAPETSVADVDPESLTLEDIIAED